MCGRINRTHNDSIHARRKNSINTGRRLAMMPARLERDKDRFAARTLASRCQRMHFSVRPTECLVVAFAKQVQLVINNNRANWRVRLDGPKTTPGQFHGVEHHGALVIESSRRQVATPGLAPRACRLHRLLRQQVRLESKCRLPILNPSH